VQTWIRVWAQKDLSEIQKHLLIVGDVKGDCGSCREFGLDYKTVTTCPNCKSEFTYITSRRFESNPGERFQIVKRLGLIRHDLTWVDYDDYRKLTGRQKAQEFFSD
jgi:hypothetical protein